MSADSNAGPFCQLSERIIEQKAKDYARLLHLQAFSQYLANQTRYPGAVAGIRRAAQEMVDRLTRALSATELNQEVSRLGLYTPEDC